jgi:anti-anti-sigma regulatory factor
MFFILIGDEVGGWHASLRLANEESRYGGGAVGSTRRHRCIAKMKIQVNERGERVIIEVEGRLAGAFVPELENCWKAARVSQPSRMIVIDLKNITCVDRAGRSLLQQMYCSGAGFLGAGMATEGILEQIMEQQECK